MSRSRTRENSPGQHYDLTDHKLGDRASVRIRSVEYGYPASAGRIQVELTDSQDAGARQALQGVSELIDVKLDGRTLRARARNGAAAIPAVLAALDAHKVKAASVTLARPSLDEGYLKHAGRAFHRADDNHQEVAA